MNVRAGGAEPALVIDSETREPEKEHHQHSKHGEVNMERAAKIKEPAVDADVNA